MSCGSLTAPVQKSLTAIPNVASVEYFTQWAPCPGLDKFRAVLKNKDVSGSFRAQVVAQYAAVRIDNPDSPTSYGSALSGADEAVIDSGDISSTTGTKFFVRFGVKYDLSAGSTPATALVELQISYDSCGQIAGAATQQLVATSTTVVFLAVTGWLPALHATKMKAAMVVNSLTGNFKWRMTYRTATSSKEGAGAWDPDWDSTNNIERGATEVNTGELAPTLTGKMWVQFGITYYLSSAGNPGQASIQAAVAVRK